ncbi:MAG TPA: RNA polymerase subunit sigma-70 [Lachnospiraceae bacterium]|nr:RNA polymerase subunit sigma-70 [Lachnospiraceae bacterium]
MSREELETLISDYGKDIYSFCCQITRSRHGADDLYQDTFLKMLEVKDRLDIKENPKSYLLSVAVNLWKNQTRKAAWRQRITGCACSVEESGLEVPSDEATAEEQMISQEEQVCVRRAVDALPEKYRVPVLLFYMEELKIYEIAGILKLPQGTVKSRLYKAKKVLKKELEVVLDEKRH